MTPNSDLDETAVLAWMEANIADIRGPLTVRRFDGGQSNPTYRIDTPDRSYVLRRQPSGPLLSGAHAVDREARIMQALGEQDFPVPRVLGLCTDASVIGSWFYVMDMVEGRVFRDGSFAGEPRETRRAYLEAMIDTLARLHDLEPDALELGDYGRRGGYFARQFKRWSRQYAEDERAGRYPDMDFLVDWLAATVPSEDNTSLVHGDFRCDNMIFHPREPRVVAVLDWELSTLGDPLVDFTYHLMMYHVPPFVPWGLAGLDLAALGLPTEQDYVARYCRQTGRESLPDLTPCLVLNFFRFAAIIHGIKGRVLRGTAASPQAGELVDRIEDFARIGRELAENAGRPG